MKKMIDDNARRQLLDKLSEESTMVLETAYVYAKTYVLYGADITKPWTTAVQQASILERVKVKAFTDAYDSFKKDYGNRINADLVAILTEIQLEIEENSYPENVYGDEYGINEIISTDGIYELIQHKIDKYKAESEGV